MVPLLQKSVESLRKIIDESADANQSVEVCKYVLKKSLWFFQQRTLQTLR